MKVVLGMSGGIDSSYAAKQLLEKGYEVIGLTIQTENSSAMQAATENAISSAQSLGIEHHIFDAEKRFEKIVKGSFQKNYLAGKTPNPCVTCNISIKFPALLSFAESIGAKNIATGHYADIVQCDELFLVKRGVDKKKDQSYFLSRLPQTVLSKVIFPLADTIKASIKRDTAPKESEDICFLHGKPLSRYFEKYMSNLKPAKLYADDGSYVGEGLPITYYTPGQRKGLGLSGGPWYVDSLDAKHNAVYIKKELPQHRRFIVGNIISAYALDELLTQVLSVQVRYRSQDKPSTIRLLDNTHLEVTFCNNFSESVAPGQTAAFYNNEIVVGGGEIIRVCE